MAILHDKGQQSLPLEMPGPADPVRVLVNADTVAARTRSRKERLKAILRDMFSTRLDKSTARLGLVAIAFVGLYGLIGGRLIYLGVRQEEQETVRSTARFSNAAAIRNSTAAVLRCTPLWRLSPSVIWPPGFVFSTLSTASVIAGVPSMVS